MRRPATWSSRSHWHWVEQLICQHRMIQNSRNAETESIVQILAPLCACWAAAFFDVIDPRRCAWPSWEQLKLEADNAHNDQSAWLLAFLFVIMRRLPCYLVPSSRVRLLVIPMIIFLQASRSLVKPHSSVSVQFVMALMSSIAIVLVACHPFPTSSTFPNYFHFAWCVQNTIVVASLLVFLVGW